MSAAGPGPGPHRSQPHTAPCPRQRRCDPRRLLLCAVPLALLVAAPALASVAHELASSSSAPSPTPERWRLASAALSVRARRGRPRGKYRANALVRPQHWVRSEDPAHPQMRTPVDLEDAHTMNAMPENSFWKDHDSDQDEGHPNLAVERLIDMSSDQLSQDMDHTMEQAGFDLRPWSDVRYPATIEKYKLRDIQEAKHLCPKLYFEPRGSSEEEDFAELLVDGGHMGSKVPTMDEPFCMRCQALLGAPVPAQGLHEVSHDARCRQCGLLNPHGPDGILLTDAQVGVAEFEPSQYVAEEQQAAAERFMAEANDLDDVDLGLTDARPTTEQRCIDCGFKTAYYWTRQVRGADEGQTAFFECVRCGSVWNIK